MGLVETETRERRFIGDVVLESPHRDEYGSAEDKPIAPARGTTGARIHKHLCHVLNRCQQM